MQEVPVWCPPGNTSRALGECAAAYRLGWSEANSKISSIRQIMSPG